MVKLQVFLVTVCWLSNVTSGLPYMFNPYYKLVSYNYPSFYSSSHSSYSAHVPFPSYGTYVPPYTQPFYDNHPSAYVSPVNTLPTVNIFAKSPHTIDKSFTVVPMLIVPEDNLNLITDAHIVSLSKKKPSMTVKTNGKDTIQCTPAVRIVLETPIVVYNLKTSIMFPSHMSILHDNVRVPIRVGAVIAPVPQDTYISEDTPVSISIVYAIPTKPMQFDYVNNDRDVIIDANAQAVIVENNEAAAKPTTEDEDDGLVNRNPPPVPAGIVQGSQPSQEALGVFQNSKESPVLTELREEAKKRI